MMRRYQTMMFLLALLFGLTSAIQAQDDVMMQAFYWDVPVDANDKNGTWWDVLSQQAVELSQAGVTGIWTPAPSKGNFGIHDMGYGVFDHYDLGNYDQKGAVETRFGSRAELLNTQNRHPNGEKRVKSTPKPSITTR